MDPPRILITSHQEAREVDGVIDILKSRGAEITRRNFCRFPQSLPLTLSGPGTSDFPSYHAGWIHNLGDFSFATQLKGLAREIAIRETDAFLQGYFLRHDGIRWLNSPENIRTSANKPQQLRLAESLNIPIPDYLITNDVSAVLAFSKKHTEIVTKTLDSSYVTYSKRRALKFYTRSLNNLGDEWREGLQYSPAIFQEAICRAFEVRVTVVNRQTFSIAIDTSSLPEGVIDIRQLDYSKERTRFFRPNGVEQLETWSIEIARALGLAYVGVDWAVSSNGSPYFFEANAIGSFKWFELAGAGDITLAIAEALFALASRAP